MENQQPQELMSNNQGVWWGWWVLIIIVICVVWGSVANTSMTSRRTQVPIHTTEAATMPERFKQYYEYPTDYPTEYPLHRTRRRRRRRRPSEEEPECPPGIPGVYPDALDPVFRKCQSQKLAACYAKCHSIDPLYFYFNP